MKEMSTPTITTSDQKPDEDKKSEPVSTPEAPVDSTQKSPDMPPNLTPEAKAEMAELAAILEKEEQEKTLVTDASKDNKSVVVASKPDEAVGKTKDEVNWDESVIIGAEGGKAQPEKVNWDESAIIAAESGSVIKTSETVKNTPEKPGSTREKPIELTDIVEVKSAEELRQAVEKARAEYIQTEAEVKKANKSTSKLSKLREFLFGGKKKDIEDEKEGGAKRDKKETEKLNEEKKKAYEEAKKVFGKGLYDEKIKSFEEKIKSGEIKPEEQEKVLAELKFEIVKAAILDESKTLNEAKIAALPEKERSICMKAMARYGQLPQPARILISAAAATGATLAFSSGVGFAMVGGVFAWKVVRAGVGTTAGLLAGKGYNWAFDKLVNVKKIISDDEQKIINEIKENLVSGEEQGDTFGDKINIRELDTIFPDTASDGKGKDIFAESESEKKEAEFEKWFSGLSASTSEKLDKLATKEKRILLGKAIGQGVVIAGVAGLTSMGMEKGMASLSPDLAAKMGIKISTPPDKAPSNVKTGAPDNFDSRYTAQKGVAPGDNFDSRFSAQKGIAPPAVDNLETSAQPVEAAKAVEAIRTLKIGARGPEGAIIDNFRANPKLAESFGYDPNGKISLDKWAGTKAHQMWLQSVNEELAKPGMVEKLTEQGFTADTEGYAKAMHKIGKGSVELAPTGEVSLTDDTSFLKNVVPSADKGPEVTVGDPNAIKEMGGGLATSADPDNIESVSKAVEPGSEEFYNLQKEVESSLVSTEGRIPAINKMLEETNEKLTTVEEHLKQINLSPEETDYWKRQEFHLLEDQERLTTGLEVPVDQLPQTVQDLLPPEIINQDGSASPEALINNGSVSFRAIMARSNFSELAESQKKAVNELYFKHLGWSFENFNQRPAQLRAEDLRKLTQGISKMIDNGVTSPDSDMPLPQKALLLRNLGEMKYLQEIQGKFGSAQVNK